MMFFRSAAESDITQLIKLWNCSFGDTETVVKSFINHFGIETGVVGISNDEVACSAFIIPTDGILIPGTAKLSCSYIYAVAVEPEFRGQGLGKEITRESLRFSKERGFDFSVLKPSDAGLFDFYSKLGFKNFSYSNELTFNRSELPSRDNNSKISTVSSEEYQILREAMLSDTVHTVPTYRGIAYQAKLGGLYGLTLGQHSGCAAIEKFGDSVFIKELIVPETEIPAAVSLIYEIIPASVYKVTVPVYDESTAIASGMIYPSLKTQQKKPFIGLVYD